MLKRIAYSVLIWMAVFCGPVQANVAPTGSITSPAANAVLYKGESTTLTINAADSDGTVATVEWRLKIGSNGNGGDNILSDVTAPPFSLTTDFAGYTDRNDYYLYAYVTDNQGATTATNSIHVTIETRPTVSITYPINKTAVAPSSLPLQVSYTYSSSFTVSKVDYYDGQTLVGTATASPYNLTLSSVAIGSHNYTAKLTDSAGGISNASATVYVTVTDFPTISVTSPVANGVLYRNETNTLTATAADSDGSVTSVQWYLNVGGNVYSLGTVTTAPFSLTSNFANFNAGGPDKIYAVATDNAGATTQSANVSFMLEDRPTVSITSPANNAIVPPSGVALTASYSSPYGVAKIDYYDGKTLVGTATSSPFSLSLASVSSGTHNYTAQLTDPNGGVSNLSAPVSVVVTNFPTISVTSPSANGVLYRNETNTLTATAADSDGSVASVQWYLNVGGNIYSLGTVTTAPFSLTNNFANYPAGGPDQIYAVVTDNVGATTQSANVSFMLEDRVSITITSPANNTTMSAPATVNLAVSYSYSAWGVSKVDYYDGGKLVGTATASPYSLSLSQVAAGSHSYVAILTDTKGGMSSASAAVNVTVTSSNNVPPTVSISAPKTGSVYNSPASFSLTANASDSDGTISKVEFYSGATLLGTATTSPYVWSLSAVAAGSYSYTAKAYDNLNAVTTSAAVAVTVNALPTVSITSPTAGTIFTAPAAISLTASAADSDGSISKVEFYSGATLLGTATTSPYVWSLSAVAAGSYSYTAKAYDNLNAVTTSAAIAVTVDAPPSVSLNVPSTLYDAPASFTLTATASDTDGTISKVEFYAGGTLLGSANANPYTWSLSGVAAGSYSYTAKAYDNNGVATTSAPVSVTVNALPSVALTSPTDGSLFNAPASFTLTATASDSDGSISKVEFYDGGSLIATTTGPYTKALSNVPAGVHSYTAKAYDNTGAASTSTITVTVNSPPSVTITSPASGSIFDPSSNITLTANASDADGVVVQVEFYNGATFLGASTTAPYSYTVSSVPAGSYSYTAKAYDNSGAVTTSGAVSVTVTPHPSVNFTAPSSGTVYTAPASFTLSATATETGGSITKVEFYDGTTLVGLGTLGFFSSFSLSLSGVPAGSHSYTAKAYDSNGLTSTTAAVVVISNAPPAGNVTAPTANTVLYRGESNTLKINASDSDGTVVRVDWRYVSGGATSTITSVINPPSGSFDITTTLSGYSTGNAAIYADVWDNQGAAISTTSIPIVLDNRPSVTITPSLNGSTVTLTLASPASNMSVAYYDGPTLVGTTTTSPYTLTLSNVPVGMHTYTARATDSLGGVGTSAPATITVTGSNTPPTVSITAPLSGGLIYRGESNILTVNARDSDGTVASVSWALVINGTTYNLGTPLSSPFSFTGTFTTYSSGPATLYAIATDNQGGQATTSIPVSLDNRPTVSISSPSNGASYPAPANFTLSANAGDIDGSVTQVNFYDGGVFIGSSSVAPFSLSLTNVSSGSHSYTAQATDNVGAVATSSAVTITANALPNVNIVTPANGQTFSAPASFTLSATATDSDGSVSEVDYYEGATLLGKGAGTSYSLAMSGVAAGSHYYNAKVTDNTGNVTTSATIGIIVTSFSPTATPPAPTFNYPFGRLTVVKDTAGTAVYYYDQIGNVIQSDRQLTPAATANWYSIQKAYDALGRVTQLTYPDASTLIYTYDSYGNLSTAGSYATFTPGGSTNGYTAAGQVGQITFGNSLVTNHTYDPSTLRLNTLTTGPAASPSALQDLKYAYYSSGSIYVISDHNGTPIQTFTYDALDRLNTANGPYGALTFNYDAIGNMTSNSGLGTYSYTGSCGGGAHAVKSVTHAGGATDTYCYDLNGNMTSGPGRSIGSYDFENHPISITTGSVTTQLQYDANGMRVKKTVGASPSTVYIGKLYECSAGSCTKYVMAGDQRIAAVSGALTFYYHGDHLGSSSVVTDASGNVVQTLGYQPYGSAYLNTGSVDVHHKYTGQELDDSTGLYYYGARYYDPVLGRFVQADSIVSNGANPQAFNRYAYVLNNPLILIDPTGHDAQPLGDGGVYVSEWNLFISAGATSISDSHGRTYDSVEAALADQTMLHKVVNGIKDWWNDSVADAQAESTGDAAKRVLLGLPQDAALYGAIGGVSRIPGTMGNATVTEGAAETTNWATAAAAAQAEGRAFTAITPSQTVGANELNFNISISASEARANLLSNGYSLSGTTSTGGDILSNGVNYYSFWMRSSTGSFGMGANTSGGYIKYNLLSEP